MAYLWTFVPSLHFNDAKFNGEAERFNNFVSSFLRFRDEASNVHTFTLCCSVLQSPTDDWILYALKYEVKNLVLDLLISHRMFAPSWLSTCNSLEYLHFNCHALIHEEIVSVCVPKLRNLSLRKIDISGDAVQKLFSGCPMLDTLSMEYCNIRTDYISFEMVKSLTMDYCCFNFIEPTCFISAPCLEYVKFEECTVFDTAFKDMPNVTKATISKPYRFGEGYKYDLLSAISGVEYLELTILHLKEFLNQELKNGTSFNSLKHLVLETSWQEYDFSILSSFLKHCTPNLENISLLHTKNIFLDLLARENEDTTGPCQVLEIVYRGPDKRLCDHHQLEKLISQWTKELSF